MRRRGGGLPAPLCRREQRKRPRVADAVHGRGFRRDFCRRDFRRDLCRDFRCDFRRDFRRDHGRDYLGRDSRELALARVRACTARERS